MSYCKEPSGKKDASTGFVLGRARFAAICAVEGIALTPDMKRRASEFENLGLSAAERRREIIKVYRKPQ